MPRAFVPAEESRRSFPERGATQAHAEIKCRKLARSEAPRLGMQPGVGERAKEPRRLCFLFCGGEQNKQKCLKRAPAQSSPSPYLRRTVFLLCDASRGDAAAAFPLDGITMEGEQCERSAGRFASAEIPESVGSGVTHLTLAS